MVKMLAALEEFGIIQLTKLFNKMVLTTMALRLDVCYLALWIFAVFHVKKFAFCSSFNLYVNHTETSLVIKASFTYSSLWIYSQETSFQLRPSRSSIIQLILLLCGDIETCPGPGIKCSTCLKTIRKNQARSTALSVIRPSPQMLESRVRSSLPTLHAEKGRRSRAV